MIGTPYDDRPDAAKRLEQARETRGFKSGRAACTFFGWNYATYAQHENGTRGIGRAADKYARAFRVSEGWLLTGEGDQQLDRTVPIVGYAGAGPDGSVLFAEGQGNYGEATAPIDAAETAEALEVRGDSMHGLANDGWLIFYEEKAEPQPEHMGEPCVCWLASGRVLIKEPQWGSSPGLFHLTSLNARTMPDVPVEAMALVTDIKTRAAAKKYIRRHPTIPIDDLVVDR